MAGVIAVVFVLLEWARVAAQGRRAGEPSVPSVDDAKAKPASR
jgi:hypothetical protein